jgi:hypothetical protein
MMTSKGRGRPARKGRCRFHRNVGHAGATQVLARRIRQLRIDLDRPYVVGMGAQQRRHVAGAGADLQHVSCFFIASACKARASTMGANMRAAPPSGICVSAKASRRCAGGTNSSRLTIEQGIQDVGVQHLAGAQLLLDHVEPGLFEIHHISRKLY